MAAKAGLRCLVCHAVTHACDHTRVEINSSDGKTSVELVHCRPSSYCIIGPRLSCHCRNTYHSSAAVAYTSAQVRIGLQALRASHELSSSICPALPAACTWLERAQPQAEGVSSLIAQGHVDTFAREWASQCGRKIQRTQILCQQPVPCSRPVQARWRCHAIKPGILSMSRTACAMLKYATRWALLTALVLTSSPCVMPETDLRGPWTPTHERDCAASIPLDGNSGRPDIYTSGYPVDAMAYLCCPRPSQRQRSQRSLYSFGAGVGQYSARAGRYPMHGARSRLRQSANPRSDCKHDSGADAQYILCPGDLMLGGRVRPACSAEDRSDGYPALRVAFGHRQLRVLLVSSHACHGWSYRDACRLYESKQPALLCAAIAITLLCYAVLIVNRSDCSEMLRSPTLNATERRAELGPKSQHRDCKHRYLLFALLLLLNHTTLAEGAGTDPGKPRVVIGPATMTGASTGIHTSSTTDEAKTCGEGPKQPSPNIRKIAFRKATARAHSAGLAQYRGRTLRAAPRSEPSSQHGTVPTLSRSRNPPHSLVKAGRITVMSYNAGGLSTHHYTELLAWLHIQRRQHQGPDVVMVQETHWLGEQDYSNDEWHVLSSGCDRRQSGLLIMLAKTKFPHATIRKEIAVAGRLLSTRIQQGPKVIHLINVYQKVWNGTPEAKQLRAQVLDALQQQLQQAPSRYPLIIAGDFNASLEHKPPCTGSAVTSTAYAAGVPDLDRLHGLLKQFDLRALNTFCPQSEKHTFTMYDSRKSQIDYVIVRARSADSTAKAPRVLRQTQLAQWKMGSVHHPVMASVPARFWHHPHQVAAKDGDRAQALRRGLSPNADKSGFLAAITAAMRDMQTWDTTAVNAVLTTAAEQYLVPNCPRRPSKPVAAEQPVKHMWEQYRLLKEAQRVGAASEDLKTRQDAFKQAQKVVRGFSKQRRATFLDEQLKQAAAASEKGDIRTLHTIINRIAPRTRRARPQIRSTEGKMVSPACELRIIKNFWQDIYTARLPVVLGEPGTIALDADSFAHALARLPAHKSLPRHYVPSIAWKIAARPIADLLQRTVFDAWQHDSINVPQAWRDAWLALILKPSQPGKHPSQYRPIGLTDPIGKTVLGMVREQHESEIYATTLSLPQYAYIRHRGAAQAIAKAFQHARNARTLLAEQKITLSNRKAGAKPSQLVGAVTVSIDLTKVFDSLEPAIMQRALDHSALPHAVKQLILQWHQGLHYHLQHEQYLDSIHCQRGIRQGCRVAPSVWALFTALAMHDIDVEWCKQNSTWYADDTLFQAIFHGEHQLQSTLAVIAKALHVLQTLGMTISASKCAVMIELRGTKAKRTKARIVTQHQKRPHLIVEHEGTQWRLPIVTKLDYLGAVLSYHRPEDATTDKRLQASRTAFERMKPVLSNRNLPFSFGSDFGGRVWSVACCTACHK